MLKRSSTIILISLLFFYSCVDKQTKTIQQKETYQSQYQKDDIVGVWDVFHIEITKGRYKESSKNPILYKSNYDSLMLEFKEEFTYSIDRQIAGNWSFRNDSVEIESNDNGPFPLNISSTYRVHRGNFGKNWYLYTCFYDKYGKISHTVRIVARRQKIQGGSSN